MNNWCICWLFAHILLGILIFKGLTARHLYISRSALKGYIIHYEMFHCEYITEITILTFVFEGSTYFLAYLLHEAESLRS
jgi:hypothetical protein